MHNQPKGQLKYGLIINITDKVITMAKQTMIGNWTEKKGKLKQKYAKLTDDDLRYVEGKEDELIGRVQKRLGVSKQEARRIIDKI